MTHTQFSTVALATALLSALLATGCSGDATRTSDAATAAMNTGPATMAPADSKASSDAADATGTSDLATVAMNAEPAAEVRAKAEISSGAAPVVQSAGKGGVSPDAPPIVESVGKGGAPVTLAWTVEGKPQAGVPLGIDLDLRPTSVVTGVMLQVSAGPGLDALDGHGNLSMSGPSRAGGYEHRVVVTPRRDGLAYVNVVAVVDTPSGRQIRSFAVPVVVGEGVAAPKPKSADPVQTDPDGERVRVLPALEDTGG